MLVGDEANDCNVYETNDQLVYDYENGTTLSNDLPITNAPTSTYTCHSNESPDESYHYQDLNRDMHNPYDQMRNTLENPNVSGYRYEYQEDCVEFDTETQDATHTTLQRLWENTYDHATNTYCTTKIEGYYTSMQQYAISVSST